MYKTINENGFEYVESGEGPVIILLHGLMGGIDNFEGIIDELPKIGFKVVGPILPLFEKPMLKTSISHFTKYVYDFINFKGYKKITLLGNSLGGHISLVFAKKYPDLVKSLVLTGSSGLYENSMGDSYPQRGNYDYIKKKSEEVFFDPRIATKEIVDEVFETVNNRDKLIRTLAIAKSAIRHNMSSDLPKMNICTAIIWGENDTVTPPNVANEFHKLLPLSTLYWIKECGHAPMMEHPDEFNSILLKWLNDNKL